MNHLLGFGRFFQESREEDLKLKKERVAKNFIGKSSIYAVNPSDDKNGLTVCYSDGIDDETANAIKRTALPWPVTFIKGQAAVMHES